MAEKIVQTAGKKALGDFAPDFAYFNDDILFRENWNNPDIDLKTRCIITVVALMASGITESLLRFHLINAKKEGFHKRKWLRLLPMLLFMRDSQRHGRYLVCQRKYMRGNENIE